MSNTGCANAYSLPCTPRNIISLSFDTVFICFRAVSIKVHFKLVRFKCYSEHLNEEGIQWEVKEKCIRNFEKMFVKRTHLSQVRLFLKINYKGKIRES